VGGKILMEKRSALLDIFSTAWKNNESYIYFWELLLVVAHCDLCQAEKSLNSNRNSRRSGVGMAVAATATWQRWRRIR